MRLCWLRCPGRYASRQRTSINSPESGFAAAVLLSFLRSAGRAAHVTSRKAGRRSVHGLTEVGLRSGRTGWFSRGLARERIVVLEAHVEGGREQRKVNEGSGSRVGENKCVGISMCRGTAVVLRSGAVGVSEAGQ